MVHGAFIFGIFAPREELLVLGLAQLGLLCHPWRRHHRRSSDRLDGDRDIVRLTLFGCIGISGVFKLYVASR